MKKDHVVHQFVEVGQFPGYLTCDDPNCPAHKESK